MRIVIVEDEKLIREGLAEMIRRHTDHVLVGECKNGREGIGVIQASHPDLVITDIRMNDMDGLEMLTFLHQKGERYAVSLSAAILSLNMPGRQCVWA